MGEAPHTGVISLHHKKMLLGRLTIFSLGVDALQIGGDFQFPCPNFVSSENSYRELCIITSSSGPALVHLNFKSILGQGVMLQYVLPVEENIQKLVHIFYTSRTWIPPYAKVDKSFSIKTHRQRYHKVTYWASCRSRK